jgi:transglutaminase-like putative cysteine protease
MRNPILMLLAPACVAGPAYAANDQVQSGPAPAWVTPSELMPVPDAAAGALFMRRQDFFIHLDGQGQLQYQGYRTRILHQNALELGNLAISWNPSGGAPTVHAIRVHRGNETTDVLERASFEILRREDQLEAAMLDGILTAVLRIPDLRVGDELEVAMTVRHKDPTLGPNDAGLLMLLPEPAPGRYRLRLSWVEGQEPKLKMPADMAAAAVKSDRAVHFAFDNPPTVNPPKDAPPRYRWQRIVEFSDFRDWAAVSRLFAPLYARAATLEDKSPLKQEARRIAAAHARPFDRAAAALKLVQQQVRYIYVGLNSANFTPARADETWQRRYGDCKGKTALLLALLREMGIEAEAVAVNSGGGDDGLDERLPSPVVFDHVLVRARIDGSVYWMDGTLPPVVAPAVAPLVPYRWVLPLTAQGGSIEHLPWRPDQRPDEITLHEIDARAGFDKPARIVNTTIRRGMAGVAQQLQFSGLTQSQLLNAMRQTMTGGTWQTIDDAKWRYDEKAQASILTISGSGAVNWEDEDEGARSLTLPGGGFSPPDRRARPADQDQNLPYYNEPSFECHVTTVRLPEATPASHWSFNSVFDVRMFGRNYYRNFDLRDGAIRMVRGFRVEQREINPAIARRDNVRVADFDNSMGWIYYDPASQNSVGSNARKVPATYDIDWTADSVPCLASMKGS